MLLITWSVLARGAAADAQYHVEAWTTEDGLPQNIVRDIVQTRDGYLWLATYNGLVRFDGVRFTVFDRSNSPGIPSNRYTVLYESANGDLWAATDDSAGVVRYRRGAFTTYSRAHGLALNRVGGITGDDAGRLWVEVDGQILQLDGERFTPASIDLPRVQFATSQWSSDVFWGVDEAHAYRFSRGRLVTIVLPEALHGVVLTRIEQDSAGTIWIVTADRRIVGLDMVAARVPHDGLEATRTGASGAYFRAVVSSRRTPIHRTPEGATWPFDVDLELERRLAMPGLSPAAGVGGRAFTFGEMLEDREGNVWLATEGQGLLRVRKQVVTVYSRQHGLVDRNVYPVFEDRRGAIWIGAWTAGLSRFDGGRFRSFGVEDGLASGRVTSLGEDPQGRLWVGAHHQFDGGLRVFERGRFRRLDGDRAPAFSVPTAILRAQDDAMWVGTSKGVLRYHRGTVTRYTVSDGLASDDVRVIVEGPAGVLWVGSYGGLTRIQDGRFTRWTEQDGLPSNSVRGLYFDRDGVLWIGTYDGGLGRLKDGRLSRLTTREGLFDAGAFQILEDDLGHLWMSCNRGLYRVSKRELNAVADGQQARVTSLSLGTRDGLLNAEANGGLSPGGIRARDGRLWFPTQDGVAVVDPSVIRVDPTPPPVVIEAAQLNGERQAVDRPVRVPPGASHLEIRYASLSFSKPDLVRFRYRLAGLEDAWVEGGSARIARYPYIPPGSYTFTVIAANGDGAWNTAGASLRVTVMPPFWRTPSFVALVAGLVVGLSVWGYRHRVGVLERARVAQATFSRQLIDSQERERQRIAAELHDSLGQNLLIIKNRALLGLLNHVDADAVREQFDEIASSASVSMDEVRAIAHDLRPYHLDRLGLTDSLKAMIDRIAPTADMTIVGDIAPIDGLLPQEQEINLYRIVQEGLNNVVKHSGAARAWLTVAREDGRLSVTLRDDGRGFDLTSATRSDLPRGFGITGMTERAAMLGGALDLTSRPGEGTTISVHVPLAGTGRRSA